MNAERLAALLEAENAALRALDVAAVAELLPAKRVAVEALTAGPVAAETAERLRLLATDNRRLLEQAMAVQGRVVALVADAMKPAVTAPRYARDGVIAPVRAAAPMAFSARA